MDRRTFEGPMEWEYQNKGPFDPTSPFTHAAQGSHVLQNGFASPSKDHASVKPVKPNTFATPSKSQQQRPLFAPGNVSSKPSAPPFRNPAFTTPRKPFDEVVLSEASGAEESPMQNSDYANDTPEVDRTSDYSMGSALTPAKVDKSFRYSRNGNSARKHMSGKGEIRPHRDGAFGELARHRRRQAHSNHLRHQSHDSELDDSDASYNSRRRVHSRQRVRSGKVAPPTQGGGVMSSMFHMMEEHRTAPENLQSWVRLGLNVFVGGLVAAAILAVANAVRSDIMAVNEAARQEIRTKMAVCQDEYMANGCATTDAPAFKKMCSEWYDCMTQNPDSIVRVRATLTEIAHIMNDFFGQLNIKAWGAFVALLIFMLFANNTTLPKSTPPVPTPSSGLPQSDYASAAHMAPQSSGDVVWIAHQTPSRRHRRALLDDDTDTDPDGTPPTMSRRVLPPYTPSRRHSPSKRDQSLSPVKYSLSPTKR